MLDVRSRIELYGDDALTRAMPVAAGHRRAHTEETAARCASHVKAVRGTADNPMTRAEVDEKCFHLMAPILGKKRARKLCDTVWTLEDVSSMRSLRTLVRA